MLSSVSGGGKFAFVSLDEGEMTHPSLVRSRPASEDPRMVLGKLDIPGYTHPYGESYGLNA
jgi:hypothetical protein